MSQRTQTDFMALTISANGGRTASRSEGAGDTWKANLHYAYTVTVKSDATGARIRFTYHDSVANHDARIDSLDRNGLLYAFWSFVNDAHVGELTFAEFAADFGYDQDSYSARRTHKACRAALDKFRRLYHNADRFTPAYVLERLADEGIE